MKRMIKAIALTVAAAVLAACGGGGDDGPALVGEPARPGFGAATTVAALTGATPLGSEVAMFPNGDALVVAMTIGHAAGFNTHFIKAFRVRTNGVIDAPETLYINFDAPKSVRLKMSPTGDAFVAWSQRQSATIDVVVTRKYTNGATPAWGPVEDVSDRNAPSPVEIEELDLAFDSKGEPSAVWHEHFTTGFTGDRLMASSHGSAGWSAGQQVSTPTANPLLFGFKSPRIVFLPGDERVVGAISIKKLAAPEDAIAVFRSSATDITTWTAGRDVPSGAGPTPFLVSKPGHILHQDVSVGANGHLAVVWTYEDVSGATSIQASQRLQGPFLEWSDPVLIDTHVQDAGDKSEYAAVTMGPDGVALVVWVAFDSTVWLEAVAIDIAAKRVVQAHQQVSKGLLPVLARPILAQDSAGNTTVSWIQMDADQHASAYAARFDKAKGRFSVPQLIETGAADVSVPPDASGPALTVSATGAAYAAWFQDDKLQLNRSIGPAP